MLELLQNLTRQLPGAVADTVAGEMAEVMTRREICAQLEISAARLRLLARALKRKAMMLAEENRHQFR